MQTRSESRCRSLILRPVLEGMWSNSRCALCFVECHKVKSNHIIPNDKKGSEKSMTTDKSREEQRLEAKREQRRDTRKEKQVEYGDTIFNRNIDNRSPR